MPARRAASLCVPVDGRSGAELRCYPQRAPLLTICAGRPALLVTFTAYAVEVERRFRGLPPLANTTKEVA